MKVRAITLSSDIKRELLLEAIATMIAIVISLVLATFHIG